MQWTLKNFEPTREDNLWLNVVHEESWQNILDLQSEVQHNPYDAESWGKLANWYEYLSIDYLSGSDGFPYQLNHRTSDLAVEARRRVIELRPKSGDAHFRLAEILWYTNPKVESIWDLPDDSPIYIQPNDPSIQEVLHELDLAQSYGLSEDMRWDVQKLVEMINRSVPGLQLVALGTLTATATMSLPTETLIPTATQTLPPTASPTFILKPMVSLTPAVMTQSVSATNNLLLIVALGLIVVGGVFFYLLKSKMR